MSNKNLEYLEEIISLRCKTGSDFIVVGIKFCMMHGFEQVPFVSVHEMIELCKKYPVAFLEVKSMIKGVKQYFDVNRALDSRLSPFQKGKMYLVSNPKSEDFGFYESYLNDLKKVDRLDFVSNWIARPWVQKEKD